MKKLFTLFALVLSFFMITSCVESVDEATSKAIDNAASTVFKGVDFTKITDNLNLVDNIDGVSITYLISDETIVSKDGVVNFADEQQSVTIVLYLTYNNYTESKVYNLIIASKSELGPQVEQLYTIAEVKELESGTGARVHGIVARVIYGTEKNVPVGFYVFDETDAIYVYSSAFAAVVSAGDEVNVDGTYTMYIDDSSSSSAAAQNYTGARQLVATNTEIVSTGNDADASKVATESSIASLAAIPVSTNITSNVYKVVCKVRKSEGVGFVNYYFDDLNGTSSFYAYTTANGKDLSWLADYDGEVYECLIAVQNCKLSASGSFWRIVPIAVLNKVEVTDEEYANYAIERIAKQFVSAYTTSCTFNLSTTDSVLTTASVSYVSDNANAVVSTTDDETTLSITATAELTTITITITLTYNDVTVTKDVTFTVLSEDFEVETISIAEARALEEDQTATIKGILVGFLYLSGTKKPAGFELVDESGSIAVFVSTAVDTTTDITKLSIGEIVYVTGEKDLYQPRTDNGHDGSIRLNNAEVLYHDYQNHDVPEGYITEEVLSNLINNPSTNNITNIVYKTTLYLEESNGSYKNYYIHDLEDPSLSLIVYSQNSGANGPAEYSWLSEYVGKCVEAYVTLRIGAVASKKFVWKSGILQVLGVVDTPDTIAVYQTQGTLSSVFESEYTKATSVDFTIEKGSLALSSTNVDNITLTSDGTSYTLNIPDPTESTTANLTFTYTIGEEDYEIEVSFNLTKLETLKISELRTKAVKNGDTVSFEGIVSATVRSTGATSWGFYVTDETGTIYCKTTSTVEVGDKVSIVGKLDLYYGLPQITTGATITVVSSGNDVPTDAYVKNATINDLAEANAKGESEKLGAVVYQDVVATIHVSSSRVYISVDDVEIDMYYYSNAKYYSYNYEPLESLDGKEVTLTLISYNLYNSQYTYVIASISEN